MSAFFVKHYLQIEHKNDSAARQDGAAISSAGCRTEP
jgi:hypothetical protein